MYNIRLLFFCFVLLFFNVGYAQSQFQGYGNLFTPPLNYVVGYTSNPPIIDGDINDDIWAKAQWTTYFQDIEGSLKPQPYYDTRVKMLWDDTCLYFAAELKDPHVWATLTKRDEIVFFDNDFEIFIDSENRTHQYFEIEINALNNIFDLFLAKPYRNGGSALFSWNTEGMQHAVKVQGSLNNANDVDEGWTVEIAVPFSALTIGNYVTVPKDGSIWRLKFSRVQWETDIIDGRYVKRKNIKGETLPENNWVWSPQGVIDMHRPERWGYLQFSKNIAGSEMPQFQLPYIEKQKEYLWLVYYKQKDFRQKHAHYASSLSDLGLQKSVMVNEKQNELEMQSTKYQFTVLIKDADNHIVEINDEGLIMK